MLKHLNILFALCLLAFGLSALGTLYTLVRGAFFLTKIGGGLCLLFLILLVVVIKERRIHRLMNEDDYDREREAI